MSKTNKLVAVAMAAVISATAAGSVLAQAANANANANAQAATPESVFNRWDKDKNKTLSMEEFRAGWGEVQQANTVRKLRANFNAMDVNKSGALEQSEFSNLELIKKAGAKAPMLSAFDADKNGKLEFKEYITLIGTMVKNK